MFVATTVARLTAVNHQGKLVEDGLCLDCAA